MGCGCQGRADALARELTSHPHRTAALTVGVILLAGAVAFIVGVRSGVAPR